MSEEVMELIPEPTLIEDLGKIYATENSKEKRRFGIYKCGFCGNNFRADTRSIKNKHTNSCGCYRKKRSKESNLTHNLTNTRIYKIWAGIKYRVSNYNNKRYKDYVGRGITICDGWKNDVKSFYDWAMSNGYSDDLSLDRIDNDGGYSPENCRWTTRTVQSRNTRVRKDNKSGYKGVSFRKDRNKYQTYISINSKRIHLGYFLTAVEGAIAYNNYIIENNLEGFILNEIPKEYLKIIRVGIKEYLLEKIEINIQLT